MQQKNLFSAEQLLEPLEIDSRRTEPAVWVRRLVILSRPSAGDVVRDIPFHQGLNIVRTAKRGPDETRSVAHDVGKTLLVRLLRYTLGEDWFASKEKTARIRKAMPHGIVVAEWRVAEELWAVVRPLSDTSGEESYAVRGRNWNDALESNTDRVPLDKFVARLSDAAISELPIFSPNGKPTGWKDVLAWLSRDSECGFRKPDTWRDREVNPQGLRDAKLNKLIMQWLMGLMAESEASARNSRHDSKQRLKEIDKQKKLDRERLQALYDSLASSAEFTPPQFEESSEPPPLIDLADELYAYILDQATGAKNALEAFERESSERLETLRLRESSLEDQKTAAVRETGEARTKLRLLTAQRNDESRRVEGPGQCPAKDDCAWLVEIKRNDQAGRMASEEEHLSRLDTEIEEARKALGEAGQKEGRLVKSYEKTRDELNGYRITVMQQGSNLQSQLGRWESLSQQNRELKSAISEFGTTQNEAEIVEKDLRADGQLITDQPNDRDQQALVRILENCYSHVLTQVFGDDGIGNVEVENGLKPATAATLIAHGTALSAMTRVISFELSCVLASMCGLGCHPRLLIHDGPREGEMEVELFRILFQTVSWLESVSPEPNAAFQYILTSADVPDDFPPEHASVVLELSGRSTEGLLLKKSF